MNPHMPFLPFFVATLAAAMLLMLAIAWGV
jgi:hypothetical protein